MAILGRIQQVEQSGIGGAIGIFYARVVNREEDLSAPLNDASGNALVSPCPYSR